LRIISLGLHSFATLGFWRFRIRNLLRRIAPFCSQNCQTVEQTVKIRQQTISESAVGVWAEIASSTPGGRIMAAHLLALVLDCIQFIVEM
jgi:hypothetical protein